tara:strand:- start:801 stop:1055 length:255 start_codon:yes stop_codon:yes gene_type:complete
MFKEIKDNLLQVNLLNQSIIELLIEKKILTQEEVEDKVLHNQKLFVQTAKEFAKLINEADKLKERVKPTDEELLDIYWGPIGKA